MNVSVGKLNYIRQLEAESIYIIREVVAQCERPVLLYSIGKNSSVLLHLARKAFYPAPLPFPLLHVDTTWKFKEMTEFRDKTANELGLPLIVYTNTDAIARNITPFSHGSSTYTQLLKTEALKQALDQHQFDAAIGGARRDEEASRSKERVFSFRDKNHTWDPRKQRPEPWNLFNAKKKKDQSFRVFPLSNWTELDVWLYIYTESLPVVPLYFAKPRPVVVRDNTLIMVDDDRFPLNPGEVPSIRSVRFRTLGCYPLTGAIESEATSLADVIGELIKARNSERQGRLIDKDSSGSMERKKREGYF